MKQFYSILLLLLVSTFTTAQNLEYSLNYITLNSGTNNYQVSLSVTPDFTQSAATLQNAFITFSVPTGLTIGNFVAASSPNPVPVGQFNVDSGLSGAIDGSTDVILLTIDSSLGGGSTSIDLVSGTAVELVRFDVQATTNPTSGAISLLTVGDAGYNSGIYPNYINFSFTDYIDDGFTNNLSNGTADTVNFAALGTFNTELNTVSIYPNPVKDVLNIQGLDTKLKEIEIYTLEGRKVVTQKINLNRVNTSKLSQGVYFLKLKSHTTSKTLKFVKK